MFQNKAAFWFIHSSIWIWTNLLTSVAHFIYFDIELFYSWQHREVYLFVPCYSFKRDVVSNADTCLAGRVFVIKLGKTIPTWIKFISLFQIRWLGSAVLKVYSTYLYSEIELLRISYFINISIQGLNSMLQWF